MATAPELSDAGRALWATAIRPEGPLPPYADDALRAAAARFAWLTSPATAAWLFQPLAARLAGLGSQEAAERARQLSRFMRASALRWMGVIAGGSVEVLAMKGFASAARIYPDPGLRAMSDVDLLVRPADLQRLCRLLTAEGFRFMVSSGTPPWGLSSESSFHPLVAPDGAIRFDLHVAADDYPVPRAVPVEDVFARASRVEIEGVPVLIPSDEDLTTLAITHAGRDKFGPAAMRAVTDLVVGLARADLRPDWDVIAARAERGGFTGAVAVAVNLLVRLGVGRDRLRGAPARPFGGPARVAFEAILSDYLTMFAERPTRLAMQARDWVLISSPRTLAHRNWRRVVGLVRPWPGVPEGFAAIR